MILLFSFLPNTANGEENSERVIITFNETINQTILADPQIEVHHLFDQFHAVSATIPTTYRQELLKDNSVKMIEPDPVVMTNMQKVSWGIETVHAHEAHASGFTGKGVKIGILDSGIYMKHPDLAIAGGTSFIEESPTYHDEEGHGTHVAGIIAALDNNIGAVGVAPDAEIYAIKVIGADGLGNHSDVVAGIQWAMDHRLDMINLSITTAQKSTLMERVFEEAYGKGLLIIAAAGNTSSPSASFVDVLYPSRFPTVIAVGSINSQQQKSSFSYYGPSLEFVAPGENIYSTYTPDNNHQLYAYGSGTSMATPFVTGVAALYKEAYPKLSNKEIRSLMQTSTIDLGVKGRDPLFGYGLIQAPTKTTTTAFPDVKKGAWYDEEINYLYNEGIVSGYENGYFYPNRQVTRAEAITMIGRALQLDETKQPTPYVDVSKDHFASGFITSATKQTIITGFPNNEFKPNAPIIRGDVAVMIHKALPLQSAATEPFSDVNEGRYYDEAIHFLKGANITNGYPDGTYRPLTNITRAEFSVMLVKALQAPKKQ